MAEDKQKVSLNTPVDQGNPAASVQGQSGQPVDQATPSSDNLKADDKVASEAIKKAANDIPNNPSPQATSEVNQPEKPVEEEPVSNPDLTGESEKKPEADGEQSKQEEGVEGKEPQEKEEKKDEGEEKEKKKSRLGLVLMIFLSLSGLFLVARFLIPQALVYLTQAAKPKNYSLSNSYVFGSPLLVAADGESKIRVNAFLLNDQGRGVPDKQIVLLVQPKTQGLEGNAQIKDVQPVTDEFGKSVFEVVSSYAGQFIVQAQIDGFDFPQSVTLTFK